MPDTIKLHLMENRSIQAEFNNRPYSYEGGINIVAGEVNATQFEIASVPERLAGATVSLAMTNSLKEEVSPPTILDNVFQLPIGMAVAGYGQFVITLEKESERVVFLPFKIKVANTNPNWKSGVINVLPFKIGGTKTLPAGSEATVENVGTDLLPVLEFGIPAIGFDAHGEYPNVTVGNAINAIPKTEKGVASGVATLDDTGKVPTSQLPSYVDDVEEYTDMKSFPEPGEEGKIYIAKDTNITYRWSGTFYVEISQSLALGETNSTAYAGNKGKANADNIAALQTRMTAVENKNTEQSTAISTAVQTVTSTNGIRTSKSDTEVTVSGITAETNRIGVSYLHTANDCTSYSSDNGGATPAAVKKAIITEATQQNELFNATSTHRGTMSKEDKAKLDAFGAASTYALKNDIPTIPNVTITNSGSGNAVTAITANGHTLTVTKNTNFATLGSDGKVPAAQLPASATGDYSTYDLVIRTQQEFESWYKQLDAGTFTGQSVLIVGKGSNYTRSDGKGLHLPDTLYTLEGIGGVYIYFDNFKPSATNIGAIFYTNKPTNSLLSSAGIRSIKGIALRCNARDNDGYGFVNCANLINCRAFVSAGSSEARGFSDCYCLLNCEGGGSNYEGEGEGFYNCSYASNCRGMFAGTQQFIDRDSCANL